MSGKISWDSYFFNILEAVSQRATCNRGRSGAVIVKENRIIATGYVGAAAGSLECDEVGHLFEEYTDKQGNIKKHCIRTIHAEQNAIAQAARFGVSTNGATIYCTMEPCINCAKLIVASGIKTVKALYNYHTSLNSRKILQEAGVELIIINNETKKYEDE